MKKLKISLVVGGIFLMFTSFSLNVSEVYICKGPKSTKYHFKENCRGLSSCSTETYGVTLSEAKKLGRTLCGWED